MWRCTVVTRLLREFFGYWQPRSCVILNFLPLVDRLPNAWKRAGQSKRRDITSWQYPSASESLFVLHFQVGSCHSPDVSTLDTEYDFVAVVEFLPESDRKQFQLAQKLLRYLAKNGVEQNCLSCNTRLGFLAALKWLVAESQKGRKFLIQFIGHGETTGLSMPDGTTVSWRDISRFLGRIDKDTIAHSVLNMTCCWGINAIKLADHLSHDACFFGVLGPAIPISFHQGYKINTKIYKKMFDRMPVDQILREVNREFGKDILFGITAEGYNNLKNK